MKNIIPSNNKKKIVIPIKPVQVKVEKKNVATPVIKVEVSSKINPPVIEDPPAIIESPAIEEQPKEKKKRISNDELKKKKEYGQFYTTAGILHEKILEFIKNKPKKILEPSTGRGDLILPIKFKFPKMLFDMYEIDNTIESKVEGIKYCDFLITNIDETYKTIVGNPPFVKTKKGNLAIDFVRKCFGLLEENGELIFIIPADFFKLTSTANLINEMMEQGTFTDIFHPSDDNLFSNANINVLLFRYCRNNKLPDICNYNGAKKKIINNSGLLIFVDENEKNIKKIEDYFDVYVGMVSGRDEIYKKDIGNIELISGKNEKEKFIYTKTFPSNRVDIDEYLVSNKSKLLERQIRKFNEDNWFEWGAPRNVGVMESQKGKKCIYIYNLTRKDEIAFEGKVDYFGGNLIIMIPKDGIDISSTITYLNSIEFKKNYMYGGRFKIGHRQLSQALLKLP